MISQINDLVPEYRSDEDEGDEEDEEDEEI
jgi:hypothetical protein